MIRPLLGRAAWTALSLILACGCAAQQLYPVSVDAELAHKNSPMVRGRLSIDGYFDNHGIYHRTPGSIRSAGDRTLELRKETGRMSTETVRLSVDSVRTVLARSKSTYSGSLFSLPSP
jgi:hypothetical protein